VDALLAVFDSPDRARSLFTVLAAISVARFGLSPRSRALSLMCSYCRSRFGLDPRGTISPSALDPNSKRWLTLAITPAAPVKPEWRSRVPSAGAGRTAPRIPGPWRR